MTRVGPKRAPTPIATEEAKSFPTAERELVLKLAQAVPAWVQRFRDERWDWVRLVTEAHAAGERVASGAMSLVFPDKTSADVWTEFSKGVAILSLMPGGVAALGQRFVSVADWLEAP